MNCPNCGDANAIALFTSIQCINHHCDNFDQDLAIEAKMKDFVFTKFKQTGTVTGRFSSKEPNFSNLPSPQAWKKSQVVLFESQLDLIKMLKTYDATHLPTISY
jgi:hypothetical protein